MELNQAHHRSWTILITPLGHRWLFYVVSPSNDILTDSQAYNEAAVASEAAKTFVDGMVVRAQLSDYLDTLQEAGKLTGGDLAQINGFLGELTKAESAFRSTVAQLQLQRPPRTPDVPTDEYRA